MKLELTKLFAPLPILRSLWDNASQDEARRPLYQTMLVEHTETSTVLVATDTHLLCRATAPEKLDIEPGLYRHFQRPYKLGPGGCALLQPIEETFPIWKRVIPDPATHEVVGEYQVLGPVSTHLCFNRLVCINSKYLSRLANTDTPYTITGLKHTEKDYELKPLRFEATLEGWNLLYVFMPMKTFNVIEHKAFKILRELHPGASREKVESAA